MALPLIDIIGFWLGIFLTFSILSFLYKDNPFYKLAEHLFIGVSIGYVVTQQYYNVLRPKLVENLANHQWWYLVPLILALMMLVKSISQKWGWVGRYPLAFVVALYAGLQINGLAQADLGVQFQRATTSVVAEKMNINEAGSAELRKLPGFTPAIADAVIEQRQTKPFESLDEIEGLSVLSESERSELAAGRGPVMGLDGQASIRSGDNNVFGTFSKILMLLGFFASLIYFYFSIAQKGAVGYVSKFGVWVLMVGFGASFGYTVQARISLAIGRALDVLGRDKDPAVADQIHGPIVAGVCVVFLIAGIVIWEARQSKRES